RRGIGTCVHSRAACRLDGPDRGQWESLPDTSPFPVKVTGGAWGALEVMAKVAFRAPAAVGVNVSWTAQLAAGATLTPWQALLAMAKSAAFAPPSATLLTVRGPVP